MQAKPHQERRGDRNLGKTKSELKWGKDAPHIQQLPLVNLPGLSQEWGPILYVALVLRCRCCEALNMMTATL